jgi:hypothetical protein
MVRLFFWMPEENMALTPNDKETDRLQRERLRRGRSARLAEQLAALGRECAALPDFDTRSPDQIVGHDQTGMWC